MNRNQYIEEAGIKDPKAEYLRRMKLLGYDKSDTIPDIGANGAFYPADPEAEPLHPDWEKSTLYSGGAFSPDGRFHADCREQYCMMPCKYCQLNTWVQICGVEKAASR